MGQCMEQLAIVIHLIMDEIIKSYNNEQLYCKPVIKEVLRNITLNTSYSSMNVWSAKPWWPGKQ